MLLMIDNYHKASTIPSPSFADFRGNAARVS